MNADDRKVLDEVKFGVNYSTVESYVENENRISFNKLTNFEKAQIIGYYLNLMKKRNLLTSDKPYVDIKLAEEKLKNGEIPFKIIRDLNGKLELWDINEEL